MATTEVIFQLKADQSEVRRALEQTSRQLIDARQDLRQLNTSFKAAQKVIENYDDTVGQLNKQLAEGTITQDQYNEALEETNNELATAEKVTEDYTDEQIRLNSEIKKLSKEQRAYAKDLDNTIKATKSAEGSNEQLRAQLALLTKEYNQLGREQLENVDIGGKLQRQIRDISDELKANESAIGDNRRNVGNYASAFDDLRGNISDTIGFITGPGALIAGVGLLTEKIGEGIEAVIEITNEFRTFRGEVQNLTGETGEELDALTSRIVSISRVFDQDFNEVLRAANTLSKQLGITQQEAAQLIETGFLSGANASGEFLDILSEYSPQLNQIGVSANEAIAIITQQVQEGIFSDKGIDSLKEAGERLALLEKPALAALEALQIDPDQLEGMSIFEQVQLISQELSKLPADSQEAAVAIDGIFGTPGLDAGFRYLTTLQDVNTEIDSLIDPTNELVALQQEQLVANERLATAQNELSKVFSDQSGELQVLQTEFQAFIIEGLLALIEELRPVIDGLKLLIDIFKAVGSGIDFVSDQINALLRLFGRTGEDIDILRGIFNQLTNALKQGFGLGLFDAIGKLQQSIRDTVEFVETIPARVSNAFNQVKQLTNDIFGTDLTVEPQININTQPAELTLEELQKKVEGLELPAPVPPDFSGIIEANKTAQEQITEDQKEEQERRNKQREQALKIATRQTLTEEKARIQLRLREVEKGTKEELKLRKQLLDAEVELSRQTRELTVSQELLLIDDANQKKIQLQSEFENETLKIQISGLEEAKALLSEELNAQLQADAQITISAQESAANQVAASNEVVEAAETNARKRTAAESVAYTETAGFASLSAKEQIQFLNDILENAKVNAEQRAQLEAQLAQSQRDLAAETLEGITQITGAFTTFFEAQKEKQLQAAQGNAEKELEIERKFAQRQKAIAITESVINTAVAVVKALPNIPLSILVGATGAIQTAAIASQSFAQGGFTGKGFMDDPSIPGERIAGVVHGGEYVMPRKVLQTNAGMGLAMQAERLRNLPGFINGGFVVDDGGINTITSTTNAQNALQIGNQLERVSKNLPPIQVSVKEINNVQNRVQVKEDTTSL